MISESARISVRLIYSDRVNPDQKLCSQAIKVSSDKFVDYLSELNLHEPAQMTNGSQMLSLKKLLCGWA